MSVVLKRAGTRSATWLAGPFTVVEEIVLGQDTFAALPDGSALKSVLTATYSNAVEMAEALATAGLQISLNYFGPAPSGVERYYRITDGKPEIWVPASYLTDPSGVWVSIKLRVAYSASR